MLRKVYFASLLSLLPVAMTAQEAHIEPAPLQWMPGLVDSNSPLFWRDGILHVFNSGGSAMRVAAGDLNSLAGGESLWVDVWPGTHRPFWIEAVWQDEDQGLLFAWYHHEPSGVCPGAHLTAPKIGALISMNAGESFSDLGIVLESGDPVDCTAKNGYFAGGHGDFSVILDRERKYFYFFFGNYGGNLQHQGVAVARMAFEDRWRPVGAVRKFADGEWTQPGLGGRVSPIFPAQNAWQGSDTDSFWGPSIHWNTYLKQFVIVMNRSCCGPQWPQEGIYVTFNKDLADPNRWKTPTRILSADELGFIPAWYPQVAGTQTEETDSVAGSSARLYVKGISQWTVRFEKPAEKARGCFDANKRRRSFVCATSP